MNIKYKSFNLITSSEMQFMTSLAVDVKNYKYLFKLYNN